MNPKVNIGIILLVIIFSSTVDFGDCCNGYKFNLIRLNNCNGSDAVIIPDQNITARLNKKCDVIVNGCMTTLGFQTAKVSYKVVKNGAKLAEGTKDACKEMETASDELNAVFHLLSFPKRCPVEAGRVCSDESKNVNFAKYKNMMGMAKGNTIVDIFAEFDGGRTACFKVEVQITK